jgi:hypothetical protein
VTLVVFAIVVALAGVVAWWLLRRFQHTDPPHTTDAHPPVPSAGTA